MAEELTPRQELLQKIVRARIMSSDLLALLEETHDDIRQLDSDDELLEEALYEAAGDATSVNTELETAVPMDQYPSDQPSTWKLTSA